MISSILLDQESFKAGYPHQHDRKRRLSQEGDSSDETRAFPKRRIAITFNKLSPKLIAENSLLPSCRNCEEASSDVVCLDCDGRTFCKHCFDILHNDSEMKLHHYNDIPSAATPGSKKIVDLVNVRCSQDETEAAEWCCLECNAAFCDNCFTVLHKKKSCHRKQSIGDSSSTARNDSVGFTTETPAEFSVRPPPNNLSLVEALSQAATRRANADTFSSVPVVSHPCNMKSTVAIISNPPVRASAKLSSDDICAFSKLKLKNRLVSMEAMESRMNGRRFVPLKQVSRTTDESTDWVTIGVLGEMSGIKATSNGGSFATWRLFDLNSDSRIVLLFEAALSKWKSALTGTVFGLLNPKILKESSTYNKSGEYKDCALSLSAADQLLNLGTSADFGRCNSIVRKTGLACGAPINIRTMEFCSYHVTSELAKATSRRTELRGDTGVSNIKSLKLKELPLKKNESYVVDGKCITAAKPLHGPLLGDVKEKRLKPLFGPRKDIAPQLVIPNSFHMSKRQSTLISLCNEKTKEMVLKELTKSNCQSTFESSRQHVDVMYDKAAMEELKKDLLSNPSLPVKKYSSRKVLNSDNSILLSDESDDDFTPISRKPIGDVVAQKLRIASQQSRNALDMAATYAYGEKRTSKVLLVSKDPPIVTAESIKRLKDSAMEQKRMEKQWVGDLASLPGGKEVDAVPIQCLIDGGAGFDHVPSSIKANISNSDKSSIVRSTADKSVLSLASILGNVDQVRGELGLKRNSLSLPDGGLNTVALNKVMERRSINAGFVKSNREEAEGRYVEVMTRQEKLVDQLESMTERIVTSYMCRVCDYTATSPSSLCRTNGHNVCVNKTCVQRFFECRQCEQFVFTLDQILPMEACKKCGSNAYRKRGLKKDRQKVNT